jgi:hypothetical protein
MIFEIEGIGRYGYQIRMALSLGAKNASIIII